MEMCAMKKQYIILFFLMSIVLLLTACHQDEDGKSKNPNDSMIYSDDLSESENVVHDLTFDYGTNRLVLFDLVKNVEQKSIELNKNSYVRNIMKWNQGYAVEVLLTDEPVKQQQTSGVNIVFPPDKYNGILVQLYDENLKLQKEIDLTDILPKEVTQGAGVVTISNDGSKIVWGYFTDLYMYDLNSGKLTKILDDTTNQVDFEKIAFTQDNHKLIFFGNLVDHNEDELSYGMIELDSKKISVHTENQFLGSDIQITNRYASITDSTDPRNKMSSGKVLIVDTETGESFTVKVDGEESTMARITEDGKYLLAVKQVNEGNYRIRQYQLQTGKVVKEENFEPVQQESKVVAINPTQNSAVYQIIVFTGSKYDFFSFNSGG